MGPDQRALDHPVVSAIRRSWHRDTASEPHRWHPDRPSTGHCDVSSFVAWEHIGGDLVLSQVLVDGELTEHHYANRVDGVDIDLTRDQFFGHEDIREIGVVTADEIAAKRATMRPDLAERIDRHRARVQAQLTA